MINSTLLANLVGYLNLDIIKIQNMINVINNLNSTQEEITNAENVILESCTNIYKLMNTCMNKAQFQTTNITYQDSDLVAMRIMSADDLEPIN